MEYVRSLERPPQLRLVEADVSRTGLDAGIADLCLAAFILHELANPFEGVVEARRLLKPGGRLVIVEWRLDVKKGPPPHVKISQEKARDLLVRAQLEFQSTEVWSVNHYVMAGARVESDVTIS